MSEQGKRLPTSREIGGSDPDFTGDETTDEYIRRIRGNLSPKIEARLAAAEAVCTAAERVRDDGFCRSAPCGVCAGCRNEDALWAALAAWRAVRDGGGGAE